MYFDQLPEAQLLILITWQQGNMVYFLRVQSVHFCDRELFVRVVIISHSTLCISSSPVHLFPSPHAAPALSSDPLCLAPSCSPWHIPPNIAPLTFCTFSLTIHGPSSSHSPPINISLCVSCSLLSFILYLIEERSGNLFQVPN